MRHITVTFIALLFTLSAPVMAGNQKPSFSEADKNNDNTVTIKEATQAGIPAKVAKSSDTDNDGKLARSDWRMVQVKSSGRSSDQ